METYEFEGAYFDGVPPEVKAYLMNVWCMSAREFSESPTIEELLRTVGARCFREAREGSPRAKLLEFVRHSLSTEEAAQLAEFVIRRERLPVEERKRLKAERSAHYQKRWMSEQPATEKQLALLRRLGHHETPASLAEASELIDGLMKSKTKAA